MGLMDAARGVLEDRLGVAIRPTQEVERMQEGWDRARQLAEEAEDLAFHSLNYWQGRPVEMVFERRQRLAQRARVAFWQDPIGGRTTEMLADFALGNGLSIPSAEDDEVQEVIDRAWKDPKNQEVLTSFDAQRAVSNTLKTQANLFPAAYIRAGKVRVSFLDADTIRDVVPDPEDELRPLYYIGHRRIFRWNVQEDRPEFEELTESGKPKVTYYEHWRNVEDAKREREEEPGLEPLPNVPQEKLDPGRALVHHVRTNRLERQHFGVPSAARSLRFLSAMNQFTESRVSKALASAAFVARRVVRGGPSQVTKAAGSVLNQVGELGAAYRGELGGAPIGDPETQYGQTPPPAASWWTANPGDQLESLDLKSGGGEAQADAQIIRAPIASSEGWGQHYIGDASNANLATATTLELPVLMMVSAWQELLEGLYRWFTDLAIEAAVRAGELGGVTERGQTERTLTELRITEAEDKAEMERRTEKSLDYKFEMPYPGRRNLPDVMGAVQQVIAAMATIGANEPLLEQAMIFMLSHGFQVTDSTEIVEEIMEAYRKNREEAKKAMEKMQGDPNADPNADPEAETEGGEGASQYGEKRKGSPPQEQMGGAQESWIPEELRSDITGFAEDAGELFRRHVEEPARIAALAVNGASEPRS
ncbi:MAG: hypothetical protein LC798_12910 [Chloroflexi bacterium]|nr:hypothetical protein [Chloroflexota bacterium]